MFHRFTINFVSLFTLVSLLSFSGYSRNEVSNNLEKLSSYENYNFQTGGDSIRTNKNGIPCEGWVVDYYNRGNVLHKGYYEAGKLKTYKNYYPNGRMERRFNAISVVKFIMETYFETGSLRSKAIYQKGSVILSEDYTNKGVLEFTEKYRKSGQLVFRKSFAENGLPESSFEVANKRKQEYEYKEFHTNGNLKEKGKMIFNEEAFDYKRTGMWLVCSESGIPVKKEEYAQGEFINTHELNSSDLTPDKQHNKTQKKQHLQLKKFSL